jgi:nucleotide-binding universal stress UspA family protein
MKSILIAVTDDESRTRSAVAETMRLLAGKPARVHLVNVQPKVNGHVAMYFGREELQAIQEKAGREALRPAQALLDIAGVGYTSRIEIGRSAETIARLAQELHCMRVVFGSSAGTLNVFGNLAQQVRHLLDGTGGCEVIES